MALSRSLMMRLLRAGPAITRSMASSSSLMPILRLLRRAARIAASLSRLARSAPEKPGVCRARVSSEMEVSRGLPLAWTWRMEVIGAVGRGDDDDVGVGIEAVHLDEDLVQRLLALVVRTTQARAALPTNGVDLVDENDAGAVALGLVEQVAYAAGAYADEHFHKF